MNDDAPQPVLPAGSAALPLRTTGAAREIEQAAQALLPPHTLMRRAGAAVARVALAVAPHAQRRWVVAGPGNNGGDGFEAALRLRGAGHAVSVCWLGDASRLPSDGADALQRARQAGVPIDDRSVPDFDSLGPDDLVIDALLGLGASRAPSGAMAEAMRRINACHARVLAVDLPSGLHADTGQPLGDVAVRADHTLALLTLHPGLFTAHGRDLAGRVWFDRLGVAAPDAAPDAWLSGEAVLQALRGDRMHAQHKGSFGDVCIVGGASGMAGAARLAARAAGSAGAGRVFVHLLDGSGAAGDPQHPELMFRGAPVTADVVVCGPGGGDAVRALLPRLLGGAPRLVLDADALNAVAADSTLLAQLAARAARGAATILTPHPLEAARLLGSDSARVQADRLAAAHALAARTGAVIVLKGSGSIIASPGRTPYVNPTGNAALATAGTGDVLAGWIGGAWAGLSPAQGFDVAVACVYLHGLAADGAPPGRALPASALVARMAASGGPDSAA